MPWLTQCYEWRLLQRLAACLSSRKAYLQTSPRDWKNSDSSIPSYHERTLEYELRKLFIVKDSDVYLVDEDLKKCQSVLGKQCTLLDAVVNPRFISAATAPARYTRLSGLVSYLDQSCATFDLVAGSNLTLFNLPQISGEQLRALTDCNKIIERISQKYERPNTDHITKVKRQSWRDSKMRHVASAVFSLIFERFSCDTSHEILVKVSGSPTEDENSPELRFFLSPCMNTDEWQEVLCGCSLSVPSLPQKLRSGVADVLTVIETHSS